MAYCGQSWKLIPNLNDKTKYVIHHESQKQYLDLGLKLKKIHRGISFTEKAWLKSYISKNTKLRANKDASKFEKDFYKLMNNSVVSKILENIRSRIDVRLKTNEKFAENLVSKPNYEHTTIFDENLVAVHMKRTVFFFNKPVYLGMSILDISKTLMYDFHCNCMKNKYGENCKLLMIDTDGLMYEIKTDDFYGDTKGDITEKCDTSNFRENNPYGFQNLNKKVTGMFKDECGKFIERFCGLRAKLYSYKMD